MEKNILCENVYYINNCNLIVEEICKIYSHYRKLHYFQIQGYLTWNWKSANKTNTKHNASWLCLICNVIHKNSSFTANTS